MRIELFHYKDVQNFLTKYLALAFTTLFLFQCSKDDTSDIAKNTELVTNTQLIIADNNSSAKILLFSENKSIPVTTEYILRMNGDIIDLDNFNFTTDTAGRYKFEAEYKGVITNTIEITAREDKVFERISIPVIFHVGHFGQSIETGTSNSNPNINASLLQLGLDDMNIIFSNNANSKEPNAVDTGVQFRLATKNPDGSLMAEPGVARYNVAAYDRGCFEFPNDPNCPDIEGNELLGPNEVGHWAIDSIWDPNLYFNIWIYPDKETRGSAGSPPVFNSHPLIGADLIAAGTTVEPSLNGIFPYMYLDYRRLESLAHEVGHGFSLNHPFTSGDYQCEDFCPDTYAYNYDTKLPCGVTLGTMQSSTVMDYDGTLDCFTYDQRERIRHMLDYALWHGNLKNSDR